MISYGTSRVVASETDLLVIPRRRYTSNKRGLIVIGGQLQSAGDWVSHTALKQTALFQSLVNENFPIIAIDCGSALWGNATAVADIEAARSYLANLGCLTDKITLLGASAGFHDALRYTRENPTRVTGVVGIMGASDLDDIRDNDRGGVGARDNINTAWGLQAGSTSATVALPSQANPNTTANANLIISGGAKVWNYYSSADTVVLPSTVTSLGTKLGATTTQVSTTSAHSDALFGDVPVSGLLAVMRHLLR